MYIDFSGLESVDKEELFEFQVIGNGDNVAGTILSRISPELRQKIEEADLLLAKGQGMFVNEHRISFN